MYANPVSPCDRKTQNQNREAMKWTDTELNHSEAALPSLY